MKRILAWALTLVLVFGLFAGCNKQEEAPATTQPAVQEEVITANDAMAYLKALYPKSEEALKTPINYDRPGVIRVGGIPFTIVWSTDLPEEQIKIVVSEDGATVTMDVNEQCEADTAYVLTATITDEQGNSASTTWDCILPAAIDMVALVKEAYALKNGESLPYEATLRGKIINIGAAYNPEYQNITVTIEIEGAEDMPIECYRLKGDGADKLQVGNIITVTGTLKNYQGKIEFDAGCVLDAVEKGDAVDAPTDVGEILKAAYKLKDGKSLPYTVELTGVVTTIDNPYDPGYKNISVIIEMEGYSKYPILCYRLKGAEAENIAIGDTITVTGLIKNYKGTIEFDAGCQLLKRVSGGGVAQKPSDDEDKILKDAKKLGADEKLPYVATLTGQVFSIDEKYSTQYDNITVTMKVSGTRICCFHMKGDGVSKIKVGDTITVSGTIVNYKGEKLEFSPASLIDRQAGNGKIKVELGPVEDGQSYYAEMKQGTLHQNLYFNGKISDSGYLKTTDNSALAVKVIAEEVSGKGTRFYFDNNGTKTYIELVEKEVNGEAKQRAALVTEPTKYWNYDSELKVYFFDVNGVYCALGTYSNFDTISATKLGFLSTKNIGKSQFVVKYVTEPSEAPEQPDTPVTPPSGATLVEAPVAGTAYKFGMVQPNVDSKLFFLTGAMSSYYMATTEDAAAAVDVYLEETTGGYYLYAMIGGAKKYINMVVSGTHVNGAYENTAATVYTYDTTNKTVIATVDGAPYWFGTRNDNTYTTVGPCKTEYAGFYCQFYTVGQGGTTPEQPENPEQPAGPTVVETPVAGTAYKFGMVQANVENKIFYLTGAMSSYYMATTEDAAAAVDVYLEETTGGYYLYAMVGGAKKYINMVVSGTHVNGAFEAAASTVYTYDATSKTVIATVNDAPYWFGTRNDNTYTTVGPVKTEYNGFYCQFYGEGQGGTTPEQPENPEQPAGPTVVETPVAGTAYKFGMVQANVENKIFYLTGAMSSYYMATTEDVAAAVDVYLEETTGGYYLYAMVGGAKKYINMVVSGTHVNGAFEAAASTVYTYDATSKTVIATVNDAPYWFGTRNDNTYTTVGPCKTEYNGFYCQFYGEGQGGTTPEQPPVNPEQPSAPTVVETPVAGTAYKFGMVQANVENKIFYLTGAMSSYYMATTEDAAAAVDVYLEETTGGYYLYAMVGGAKKYINMVVSGTHVNGAFEAAASTVYTYDATSKTVIATVNDAPYWFGTRNDNTYTTVGPCKTEYNGFYCQFYGEGQGGTTPEQPPVNPEQPAASGSADFDTIVTSNPNGDGGYTNTYTTTNGWTTVNCAIQSGGATVMNPQYPVIGPDNTYKAVCLNGKVSAPGKITSPKLTGGISKLTVNYTKMFTDTELSVTVTVTEVATGNTQTHVIAKSLDKNEKYVVYTDEWTLETPVAGEFTIEIVNNSPTANAGNKDRMTILSVNWEGAASGGSGSTTPEQPPVTPEQPAGPTVVETPVAGTAYKFGMVQANVENKIFYLTGAMSSYYMATTEDAAAAVDVYLEETTGGYYLYAMVGGAKKYINMVVSGTHVNGAFEAAASTVYTYDATSKTVIATVNDAPYWFGTRNDNTYTTVGPCKTEYNGFYCQFYTVGQGSTTPEQPETPETPAGNTLTIQQALDMGAAMGKGEYTVEKYQITATVKSIEHTTYGNMYIQDANGTEILVYGTWDATGVKKYGEMTEKPTAGATVTLLSVVGNYNGTPQLKDAWIISFVPSATPAPEGPAIPAGGICLDVTVKENRTAYSTSQQVWEQNGIKLTNNKGASTSNVGDYCPIRLYKNSDVTIEYAGMTKLVFDCTNIDKKYAEDAMLPTLQAVAGATVTMEGKIITVVLDAPVNSFSFTTTAQSRLTALYVYTN